MPPNILQQAWLVDSHWQRGARRHSTCPRGRTGCLLHQTPCSQVRLVQMACCQASTARGALGEDVLAAAPALAGAALVLLQPLLPIAVVDLALLAVGERLVGCVWPVCQLRGIVAQPVAGERRAPMPISAKRSAAALRSCSEPVALSCTQRGSLVRDQVVWRCSGNIQTGKAAAAQWSPAHRVILQRQLAVGALDLGLICALRHLQDVIVVLPGWHRPSLSSGASPSWALSQGPARCWSFGRLGCCLLAGRAGSCTPGL